MSLSEKIHNEGLDIGYTRVGAIALESIDNNEFIIELQEKSPWAKAIIIGAYHYNFYKIPENLKMMSKGQLFQGRYQQGVEEHEIAQEFEEHLKKQEIQYIDVMKMDKQTKYILAEKMHIGIIRKNSHFYTDEGSYCTLHAWLVDAPVEWLFTEPPTPCPGHCSRCIRSCPEKALIKGYVKDYEKCTSINIADYINHNHDEVWEVGCDHCQDICPYNRDRWENAEEFPGLKY